MNKKIFSIHSLRNVFAAAVVIGLGYAAYIVNPNSVSVPKVEAGAGQNVSGFVWGENFGWISLNGNDCDNNGSIYLGTPAGCPTNGTAFVDYGVNISPVATTGTGDFSGNAWSEYLGWVSFDRASTGAPPQAPFNGPSGTIAQVDWNTGNITGWTRALVLSDGWIKLSEVSSWSPGVKIDTAGKFSGYAWGAASENIGWIDFAPLINGVTPLPAPAKVAVPCTTSTADTWGSCSPTPSSCVSGGAQTQTNLTGVRYGTCSNGNTGTVTDTTCIVASTSCTAGTGTAGASSWFKGDGVCSTSLGENSTNSLTDCKPKTKFWQF